MAPRARVPSPKIRITPDCSQSRKDKLVMLRIRFIIILILTLALMPDGGTGRAATNSAQSDKSPAYAPGQVLVHFAKGTSSELMHRTILAHSAGEVYQLHRELHIMSVPIGQETRIVERLEKDPAVAHASLNYRITQPKFEPIKL